MKLFTQSFRKFILGGVLASMLVSSVTLGAQAPQKNWKDTAEYELYVQYTKATTPDQQLQLLNQWKEKYPESEYKMDRAMQYIVLYNKKNDPAGLYQACKDVLVLDPKSFQALYFITLLTVSMNKQDAESLNLGGKAANSLIAELSTVYDPSKKPAGSTDAQWKQQSVDLEVQAIKTLGWIEQQKKNFTEAEKFFVKGLELSPGTAELSYLLGTVIVQQKNPKRQAEAMWHFARAGNLDGPGAMDPTRKAQVAGYFQRVYTAYAGDDKKEMAEIIEKAKASVMPPPDFKIKSKEEKMGENEEKFKSENPMLFQYLGLKKALLAADGETYWGNVKDAELPTFKGKLVSMKPDVNPKELVLAVESADQPEVTLVLDKALRGKAEPGTEIQFTGVAKEYTKEPFTLKLEVDNEKADKLKGWPVTGSAPKAAVKKAAPRPVGKKTSKK